MVCSIQCSVLIGVLAVCYLPLCVCDLSPFRKLNDKSEKLMPLDVSDSLPPLVNAVLECKSNQPAVVLNRLEVSELEWCCPDPAPWRHWCPLTLSCITCVFLHMVVRVVLVGGCSVQVCTLVCLSVRS